MKIRSAIREKMYKALIMIACIDVSAFLMAIPYAINMRVKIILIVFLISIIILVVYSKRQTSMYRRMEWKYKSHLWLDISSSSVCVTLNHQHLCLLQSDQNSSSEVSLES